MPTQPLAIVLACVLLSAAGCASRASMDIGYEQSLARWKDASRADLVARWGEPTSAQRMSGGEVLVYVVHHDFENRPQSTVMTPTVSATPGGVHVVTSGMAVAPLVPVTCTTRFTLQDGRVASWSFEGIGCGAPQ